MWSQQWYPRLISTPEVDALTDVYSSEEMNEGLVIRWEPRNEKKFGFFSTVIDFLQFFAETSSTERCFHEIFAGAMKPCFDIDLKASEGATQEDSERILEQLITGLVEEIQKMGFELELENDLIILTSHAPPRKWSYHLIVNTFCLPGPRDCGVFTSRVIQHLDESLRKFVDPISSPNKSIRILGSCKTGEPDRVMIWENSFRWNQREYFIRPPDGRTLKAQFRDQMERSLASWTEGLECCEPLVKVKAYTGKTEVSDNLADAALRALADNAGLPLEDPSFPYSFRDIRSGCVNLNRLRPTTCPVCLRQHESDNIFLRISGPQRRVEYVCHRALQERKDGKRKVTTICVAETLTPYLLDKNRGRTTATGRLKGVKQPPVILPEDSKPMVRKCRKPPTKTLSRALTPNSEPEDPEKSEDLEDSEKSEDLEDSEKSEDLEDSEKSEDPEEKPKVQQPRKEPKMPVSSFRFRMKQLNQ